MSLLCAVPTIPIPRVVRLLRASPARLAEKNVTVTGSSAPGFFSKPTAAPTPAAPSAAEKAAVADKAPGSWRSRMSAFAAGVAVTAVFGYIRLRQDVWSSTADVKARVSAAHGDVSVLIARIQGAEKRIAELEEANALRVAGGAAPAVAAVKAADA